MERIDPVSCLINSVLDHIRKEDPTWDEFQPVGFRAIVVEHWKIRIHTELWNDQIRWNLPIGDREFFVLAPMFTNYDMGYNPYVDSFHKLAPSI